MIYLIVSVCSLLIGLGFGLYNQFDASSASQFGCGVVAISLVILLISAFEIIITV